MQHAPSTMNHEPQTALEKRAVILGGICLCIYVLVHAVFWASRLDMEHQDHYNYINVAANVRAGLGLVQNAMGFNQRELVGHYEGFPSPYETQPPLFPLAIAAVSFVTGLDALRASFLLPLLTLPLTILSIHALARSIYGPQIALLAAGLSFVSLELRGLSDAPYSEAPAILFTVLTLWILHRRAYSMNLAHGFFAGLCAGAALATRYGLSHLIAFAALHILITERKRGIASMTLSMVVFAIGCAVCVLPMLARNLLLFGFLLPTRESFDPDSATYLGQSLRGFAPIVAFTAMIVLAGLLQRGIRGQRGFWLQFLSSSTSNGAWIVLLWMAVYCGILAGVQLLLDLRYPYLLTSRILAPGLIPAIVWQAAQLAGLMHNAKPALVTWMAIFLFVLALLAGLYGPLTEPRLSKQDVVKRYGFLSWMQQNTTERDIVIGNETVMATVLLDRPMVVSLAEFPYAPHLEYNALVEFLQKRCGTFDQAIVFARGYDAAVSTNFVGEYGVLIDAVLRKSVAQYPLLEFADERANNVYYRLNACKTQ